MNIKKYNFVFLLLLTAIFNKGCGGTEDIGPMSTLSGIIVLTDNQDPVIGATLRSLSTGNTAVTDENGFYTFPNIESGKIAIELRNNNSIFFNLDITSNVNEATVDFVISPPSAQSSSPSVVVEPVSEFVGQNNFIFLSDQDTRVVQCINSLMPEDSFCFFEMTGQKTNNNEVNFYLVSKEINEFNSFYFVHYPRLDPMAVNWFRNLHLPVAGTLPSAGDIHDIHLIATSNSLNILEHLEFNNIDDIPSLASVSQPQRVMLEVEVIIE